MLDKILRQHHRADGQIVEASGHPGVDNPVRLVPVNKILGAHGGVHLPDAPGVGQDARLDLVDGNPAGRLQMLRPGVRQQAGDLLLHGVGKSDPHSIFLPFFPQYTTAGKFGKEKIFIDIQ